MLAEAAGISKPLIFHHCMRNGVFFAESDKLWERLFERVPLKEGVDLAANSLGLPLLLVCLSQRCDVDFGHLQHCLHDSL